MYRKKLYSDDRLDVGMCGRAHNTEVNSSYHSQKYIFPKARINQAHFETVLSSLSLFTKHLDNIKVI